MQNYQGILEAVDPDHMQDISLWKTTFHEDQKLKANAIMLVYFYTVLYK